MGAQEFGQRIDAEMRRQKIGPGKLAARIGELSDGRTFDTTGVKLMRESRRRSYDPELVQRIADALGMDRDEAYHIARVWPMDLDLDTYRALRQRPLEPVLTHARGGQQTPTAFSLRTTRSTPHQQGSTTGTTLRWRAHRAHRSAKRPTHPKLAAAA